MLEHVETGLEQRAVLQALDKLVLLDQSAARAVDEGSGGLHPAELLTADGVLGGGNDGQMHGHEVGLLPDLLGGGLQLAQIADLVLREVRIVADDVHAEAILALLHGELGDTAAADHTEGLAAELIGVLHAHADKEVAAAELTVDIGETLGAHEHQHDGVLGDGVGVAGGRVDNGDVLGVGVVHVDVIEAGALLADDLEVLAGVHHLGGDGLGAAHNGVGLELGELLDVGLLVVMAAQLHFKVVGLEDVRGHLVELDGVVNFELCHDKDLLSNFYLLNCQMISYGFFIIPCALHKSKRFSERFARTYSNN